MTTSINALDIRRRLGRHNWGVPREFGDDGWMFECLTGPGRIIVSLGGHPADEDDLWLHASISRQDTLPTYDDLTMMHNAVYPNGWAYQVFAPPPDHINIHPNVLHLWGRLDGSHDLPNFGAAGTI